jgi:hypothetical protein
MGMGIVKLSKALTTVLVGLRVHLQFDDFFTAPFSVVPFFYQQSAGRKTCLLSTDFVLPKTFLVKVSNVM